MIGPRPPRPATGTSPGDRRGVRPDPIRVRLRRVDGEPTGRQGIARISHHPVLGPFRRAIRPLRHAYDRPARLSCPSRASFLPPHPDRTPGPPSIEAPVTEPGRTAIARPRHRGPLPNVIRSLSSGQHLRGGRRRARFACTRRNTSAYGQPLDSFTHTFRTVTRTRAPIFNNFNRIVWHCEQANSVPANPSRRNAPSST